MTDDRIPFLRAILLDVTAAAPRLVYADWLEDHGECERSEFVRVQVELAAMPKHIASICNCCGRLETRKTWSPQSRCMRCRGSTRKTESEIQRDALRCREAELFQASIFECVEYWRKLVAWNDEQIELEAAVRGASEAAVTYATQYAAEIAERGRRLYPHDPRPKS